MCMIIHDSLSHRAARSGNTRGQARKATGKSHLRIKYTLHVPKRVFRVCNRISLQAFTYHSGEPLDCIRSFVVSHGFSVGFVHITLVMPHLTQERFGSRGAWLPLQGTLRPTSHTSSSDDRIRNAGRLPIDVFSIRTFQTLRYCNIRPVPGRRRLSELEVFSFKGV